MSDRSSSKSSSKKRQRTTQKPEVLVVIPTLGKRANYLRLTLESIASQAPVSYDIVIVTPMDSKETKKLADEFGAQRVADPRGMSAAVNAGIAQAKPWHKYVSWIGDDDLIAPDSFANAIAALEAHPSAPCAFGYCDYIDADGKHLFTSRVGRLAPWILTWGPDMVPMPGLLMRLSALHEVGEFDEENKYCMDLEMLLRLRKVGKFANTGKTLASFRWHSNSQTVLNRDKVLRETMQVKRRNLPAWLRPFSFLWDGPVWLATLGAVRYVDFKAKANH